MNVTEQKSIKVLVILIEVCCIVYNSCFVTKCLFPQLIGNSRWSSMIGRQALILHTLKEGKVGTSMLGWKLGPNYMIGDCRIGLG